MFKIVEKKQLNLEVVLMRVAAPLIARKAKAGQFIILRLNEEGERIPLTIADVDEKRGLVTIIFQIVGKTTSALSYLKVGETLADFVGPLGKPSNLAGIQKACVIGGGLGVAIAYPQAKALSQMGAEVDVIAGFRHCDLVILEKEFKAFSQRLYLTTDDGSKGFHGFVSQQLEVLLQGGRTYDAVIAIGSILMMKAVSEVTRKAKIPTVVSMNSLMLDGTGMCGACRLTVDGVMKFACVDGPEFDGHLVDYDEALSRSQFYAAEEKESLARHQCRLREGV